MHTDAHRLRKAWALGVATAALFLLPAIGAAQETRVVEDETGRRVRVPVRPERIISLAPNLTEILYALGADERLVGVTSQCDFPPAAERKPRVGDVSHPNLEKILELKPDLVLGTTAGNPRSIVPALERLNVALYGVDPRSVAGVFESIRHVGELVGAPDAGEALAARLEARLAALESRAQAAAARPRVLFVIWLTPLITAGRDTFVNDLLARAGAHSVTAALEQDWPRLSLEEVIERDPDFLLLPRTPGLAASLERLSKEDPWRQLRAVRENRVVWLDEAVMRPGPRIVDAIEELASALHAPASAAERAQK